MFGAIRYNLAHLLDFSGRDARQTFWFYVLFLVVINFVVGMVVSIPIMMSSFGTAMQAVQAGASEQEMQARIMGQMGSAVGSTLWISVVTKAAMALLLVAAFVRRLHDSDKSGWWAAVPLAAQALSVLLAIRMMGAMQAIMQEAMTAGTDPTRLSGIMERQSEFASYGLIGWLGPLVVIGFGVLKSTDGPNRYGSEPVRF